MTETAQENCDDQRSPANPNFMGTLIPGMARGMLPNMIPRNIPTNSVTMLGSWRRFVELPSFSARRLMSSIRPTTVRRSPICNSRLGLARRSRPARFTRVAFNRYPILRRRLPILRPLNSGRVTSIRRETTGAGIASQFISTGRPINASMRFRHVKRGQREASLLLGVSYLSWV